MANAPAQIVRVVTIVAALIIASGAAAALFALLVGEIMVFPLALLVISIVAFVLGLPIYLGVRALRGDTGVVAALMGFVVGAIVPAVFLLSGPAADEASVGGTPTVVHGSYTAAGWLENLAIVALFGVLGLCGGIIFWLMVRRNRRTATDGAAASRPQKSTVSLLVVSAAAVIATAFIIPIATKDRSCHNPLRNGGTSAPETASFDLNVAADQWRNVGNEVEAFGRAGNWSMQSDVRTDPSFPWLQISLCKEPGTLITVQGIADFHEVHFGVYQPQGGPSWQGDLRSLYERIQAHWPSQITFTDAHGTRIPAPSWTRVRPKQ